MAAELISCSTEYLIPHEVETPYKTPVSNTINEVDTKNDFSLLHLSDLHGNTANLAHIVAFINKNKNNIDGAIHTGDSVSNLITDSNPFENVNGAGTILNVAGNHEAWLQTSDNDYYATEKQVYDKIFANVISGWDVKQPNGTGVNDYYPCYYYKDFKKFRLIVIDTIHWHTGGLANITDDASVQRAWFLSVLVDAITNDKIVICALHYPPVNGIDFSDVGGFNKCGLGQNCVIGDGWYAQDEIFDCVDAFVANGGKFMGWIGGHVHYDCFGFVHGHNAQPIVLVNTAGSESLNNIITDNTINVITYSYFSKSEQYIKIERFVVEKEMDIRKSKSCLSYDIVNNTVISLE